MAIFAIGDIHGAYKALIQCLERSGFDKEKDTLIQLGDVADGWPEVFECVQELLTIKNLIAIRGNHDDWALTWMQTGIHPGKHQGGDATIQSYLRNSEEAVNWAEGYYVRILDEHRKFFSGQHNYYIDEENRLYVHGGFNRHFPLREQRVPDIYYWDRDLWLAALAFQATIRGYSEEEKADLKFRMKDDFKEIFIGHTSTTNWTMDEQKTQSGIIVPGTVRCTVPMKAANIWNLDTGAGFKGVLTIMNVETKQYWKSDPVSTLYPNEKGR